MPVDTSSYGVVPVGNNATGVFQQAFAQAQQIGALRDERAALAEQRRAATEKIRLETADARRTQFETERLSALFGSGTVDPKQVYSIVGPERGAKIVQAIQATQKGDVEGAEALRQHIGALIGGIDALPEPLRAGGYTRVRDSLIQQGHATPDQIPEQYAPEYVAGIKKSLLSPKEQIETAASAARDKIAADAAAQELIVKKAVAGGMKNGLTPEQQQAAADRAANTRIAAGNAAETARHNRVGEAAATNDKTDLTPEGLDAAAAMFAKTGQLPALGNGDKTTRKAIINRAAVMVPGLDVASAKADFSANSDSLRAMQKQRDAISSFEQTAAKNIDIFLETAGKVVDTGSPFSNTLARAVSGKMLGSTDQAKYDAARQVAINEVAKITSNPSMAGQLSDSARKEVEAFNPANATLKQSVAVMRVLKRDMANRAGAMDEQIAAIQARIKKGAAGGGSAPDAAAEVWVRDPTTGKMKKKGGA